MQAKETAITILSISETIEFDEDEIQDYFGRERITGADAQVDGSRQKQP